MTVVGTRWVGCGEERRSNQSGSFLQEQVLHLGSSSLGVSIQAGWVSFQFPPYPEPPAGGARIVAMQRTESLDFVS